MEIQILLIILLILLIIIFYKSTFIEGYDAKITSTTQRECGNLCTNTVGCYAFAHKDNGSCFLSKDYILGPVGGSLYSYEYKPSDYRCNKFRPIQGLSDANVPEAIKHNAIYTCSDNEQGKYTLHVITDTVHKPIGDFNDIEKMNVPPYKLFDFDWPTNQGQVIDLNKGNSVNKDFIIYEKSNDEYLGQYLFPQKCSANISQDECLQLCSQYDNCVGLEWNPYYEKKQINGSSLNVYKDVCCLKSTIDNIIPRRNKFKNGNFYLKTNRSELNRSKIYTTQMD